MTVGTVAMVLSAALAHAVWNIASKSKQSNTVAFVWVYTAMSAVICLPFAILTLALTGTRVGTAFLLAAAGSAVLHVAYSLTLQVGYDRSDLGLVYPIARGSGPVITMTCAVILFGEHLSPGQVLGAVTIIIGIATTMATPFRMPDNRSLAPALWGVATGATIAGYTLWDAGAVDRLRLNPLAYFAGTLVIETLLLAPQAFRAGKGWIAKTFKANPRSIPLIAVLSPLSYILVLIAMTVAPVAVVAPLREVSIIFGTFLAWWLFREGHLARRITGAAIVLVGIVLISA